MLRIVLIRPGATDFDEQGRIKGSLDIPLNENGNHQVAQAADELTALNIDNIYTSPCRSAQQTADALGRRLDVKVKPLDKLKNLDHGLWHGKLIEEVRQTQPKVYRQWQERPETVCPPGGETLAHAQERLGEVISKLTKKHKNGTIAVVVSEPVASLFRNSLDATAVGDLWQAERDRGTWEMIEIETKKNGSKPIHHEAAETRDT